MSAIARSIRVGMVAAALSLFSPLVFVMVLARRAGWRRASALAARWGGRVSGELDHWRYEYSLHEFWSGEMKRSPRR